MIPQDLVDRLTDALWPGESIEEAGLALAEEAGEVAKAIIKRNHARRGHGDRKGDEAKEEFWTDNLRRELAQVVIVARKIANREGFDLEDYVTAEVIELDRRGREAGVWPPTP